MKISYTGYTSYSNSAEQNELWKDGNHTTSGSYMTHYHSTFDGHSGSPLFAMRGDDYFAIAIHKGNINKK